MPTTSIGQLTKRDSDGMAPTRSWAGYSRLRWALAYVPIPVLPWVVFSAATLLNMIGVTNGAVSSFDRWNLFAFGTWFLGIGGLLLAGAAAQNSRHLKQFVVSRTVSLPRSLGGIASAVLILGGAVVVLVGVMTFHVWVYAVGGPVLLGIGTLSRLVARRSQRPV